MAAHTGVFVDATVLAEKAGISPNLDSVAHFPDGSWSSLPIVVADVIAGDWAHAAAPAFGGADHGGVAVETFDGDWYHQIHVIPRSFDLGNVVQNQTRTIEVWNAHFVSRVLNDIVPTNDDGIFLSGGPGAPPVVYLPLQSEIYTFTITLDGPLAINATYLFDFDVQDVEVEITGTRAIIFAFEPQLPVSETIEWTTDVLEAYDGTEQRIMIRSEPRQKLQFDYLLSEPNEVSRALNGLYGRLGGVFAVPVWWDLRNLNADVSIGALVIPVTTTNADFRTGGFAILWRASDDFEVIEIDTFTSTQLNLVRAVEQNHDALTTIVMPVQRALVTDPLQTSRTPNGVTTIAGRFESQETTDISATDGELTIYRGFPVFSDLNFMESDELTEPIQSGAVVIDNKTGPSAKSYRRRFPRIITVKGWQPETDAELWAIRKLLYALRGRQRTFWLPSYRRDFVLTASVGAAATTMLVEPVDYERFIDTGEPLGDIAIYLNSGASFFREVTDVAPGAGGTEQLTISSALGITVNPADILRISYLMRARLDSDVIQITHTGLGRAIITVPVVGVQA